MADVLTRVDITKLVTTFYAGVRRDSLLAPIFATKIGEGDWPAHESHITEFWCSIFLKSGTFEGNPMRKHFELMGLTPEHFIRWLGLFEKTADAQLTPVQAKAVQAMAERIAQSFQMGLAFNYNQQGRAENPFSDFGLKPPR